MRFPIFLALMGFVFALAFAQDQEVFPYPTVVRGSYRVFEMLETVVPIEDDFPQVSFEGDDVVKTSADRDLRVVLGRTTLQIYLDDKLLSSEVPKVLLHERRDKANHWLTYMLGNSGGKGFFMRFDNGILVFLMVHEDAENETKTRHAWRARLID